MAADSSPSIAPWNHERCAIFFVPPVGPFPTLGPLALVTAGFDAQTPATIQYDHLAAPLFQHRYICLELRLFGAEILDLVKLPRQRSIREQTYAHQPARSHGNPLPREPLPRFPECAFRLTSGLHHARQARDHGLCSFAKGLYSLARNSSKGFFHRNTDRFAHGLSDHHKDSAGRLPDRFRLLSQRRPFFAKAIPSAVNALRQVSTVSCWAWATFIMPNNSSVIACSLITDSLLSGEFWPAPRS